MMILYRYFNPNRINFLEKGLLCFPQPVTFNDPFDCFPDAYSKETGRPTHDMITPPRAQIRVKSHNYGVLSLSQLPDSLPMWAYYAEAHAGFVIGFDTDHGYFKRLKQSYSLKDGILRPVSYRLERPHGPIEELTLQDLMLSKSTAWVHEEEWRIVIPLSKGRKTDRTIFGNHNAYLFEVPIDSIQKIIFGYKMKITDYVSQLLGLSMTRDERFIIRREKKGTELDQAEIYVSMPSISEYKLNFRHIDY